MRLLENMDTYLSCISQDTPSMWQDQLNNFENFFKKVPYALPMNVSHQASTIHEKSVNMAGKYFCRGFDSVEALNNLRMRIEMRFGLFLHTLQFTLRELSVR